MKKIFLVFIAIFFLTACGNEKITEELDTQIEKEIIKIEVKDQVEVSTQIERKSIKINVKDRIEVATPRPNQAISSPLLVTGKARGTWFFEATATLLVTDNEENILAKNYIQTAENWMTEDFLDFTGTIEFELPENLSNKNGFVIFQYQNPSGLPKNDAAIKIPVRFE